MSPAAGSIVTLSFSRQYFNPLEQEENPLLVSMRPSGLSTFQYTQLTKIAHHGSKFSPNHSPNLVLLDFAGLSLYPTCSIAMESISSLLVICYGLSYDPLLFVTDCW